MSKNKKLETSKKASKKQGQAVVKFHMIAKILIAVISVMVISFSLVTNTATSFSRNRLMEKETATMLGVSKEKISSLEQYVTDQKTIAQLIQNNTTLIQQAVIYMQSGQMNPAAQAAIAIELADVYENTGKIYENLFVTVGSQGFADCLGNSTLHDVAEEPFYQAVLDDGYYFGNNISPVTGRPVYVIAYAINSPTSGKAIGCVNMSIDMESLGSDIVKSDIYDVVILDLEGYIVGTNKPEENPILTNLGDHVQNLIDTGEGSMVVDLSEYGKGINHISYCAGENFIVQIANDESVMTRDSSEMARNLALVSGFMLLIGIIIISVVIVMLVRPLKRASGEIQALSNEIRSGKGDLTKKLNVTTRDEIGAMVSGVNELVATLAGIISSVQNTTNNVSSSSSDISSQIEKAELEVTSVSSIMEEMSASSEQTSASLTQVLSQVDSVADLVKEVNDQSVEQASYAESVVAKVKDIQKKAVADRDATDRHLEEVTSNLREKAQNAKQVQEIANLTDEIINISSQTNLLSLNASIEAARAGEAGRGFAVVADEIRQLADNSKEAANRIQEVTSSVILAVEALAEEAESVTEFMIESNEHNSKINDMITSDYSKDINQLAGSMVDFKTSSDEIANSMEIIKEAIDAVNVAAEETAQGISNVAQSTVQLSSDLETVVNKTSENVDETNALANEMNKFTV